jgi:hypothetical protein
VIPAIAGGEQPPNAALPVRARTGGPLAMLLHALNQPLTGLQCSMEVALASPRTLEQYAQGLREGLELTGRMRALVETIREVTEDEQAKDQDLETTDLKMVLRDVLEDLKPVAEVKRVRVTLGCSAVSSLEVKAGRRRLGAVVFRFVESVLSLAEAGSALEIEAGDAPDEARTRKSLNGESWIRLRWRAGPPVSAFSRPELGLLVAQAGWERAGAQWERERTENLETVTVRLPSISRSPRDL